MNSVFTKENVSKHEYQMQKYVYELNIVNVPKIISYDEDNMILKMEKINNYNISDMYGESSENIPDSIFLEIRNIVKILYNNNVIYPDITGYNFIENDNKIWIIDFEHSYIINNDNVDNFVSKFINGFNQWNPQFQ